MCFVKKILHDFLSHAHDGLLAEEERFSPYNKTHLIQAAEEGHAEDVQLYFSGGANLAFKDRFGETALHYAAENGHLEIVKMLVHAGADTSRRDDSGRTSLDCIYGALRGQFNKVAVFLQGVKPDGQRKPHQILVSLKCSPSPEFTIEIFSLLSQLRDTGDEIPVCSEEEVKNYESRPFHFDTRSQYFTRISLGLHETKRLLMTEKGYVGLASNDACPEDRVYVFSRARVPFVLRQTSDSHWKVVGECYVQRIMNGEVENESHPVLLV